MSRTTVSKRAHPTHKAASESGCARCGGRLILSSGQLSRYSHDGGEFSMQCGSCGEWTLYDIHAPQQDPLCNCAIGGGDFHNHACSIWG